MSKLLSITIISVMLLVVGCNNDVSSSSGSGGQIKEYELKDGTRCAVFVGDFKGGLSCDWNNRRENGHN